VRFLQALTGFYKHLPFVYLNKLYDQIEITIPYMEGDVSSDSDEEDENNVSD